MHSTFDFDQFVSTRRKQIEDKLELYLAYGEPTTLWESMRYSVLSGGKRLRGILCLAAAEATNQNLTEQEMLEAVLPTCGAIEMIHAMSLIHDDLPALDNDDLRRGKPTNHKVYGEAIALLAGDALMMFAIETILSRTPRYIDQEAVAQVAKALCEATGPRGMVGGQVYDLQFTGRAAQLKEEQGTAGDTSTLELIDRGKTGALIKFSIWSGARLMNASERDLALLTDFGEILGLAFQITDDLLDATADIKTLGKTPGKDQAANKVTWVALFGVEATRLRLQRLETEGLTILDNLSASAESVTALKRLLQYAIHRKN